MFIATRGERRRRGGAVNSPFPAVADSKKRGKEQSNRWAVLAASPKLIRCEILKNELITVLANHAKRYSGTGKKQAKKLSKSIMKLLLVSCNTIP